MTDVVNFVDRLLDHVQAISWAQLPAHAQAAAITFTADTIGVGLSACQLEDNQRQHQLAAQWGAGSVKPLGGALDDTLGGGDGLSAPQAAFINAVQMHCQEYDAVHEPAVVHAMSCVSAACLADCGRTQHNGEDYLEAIVTGVDIAVNLGVASNAPMRFFRPGTAGLMGAAIALAKLNNASREQMLNALGLAYSLVSGTMQSHIEGSPALAYQIGFGARNAIFAWDMAAAGSTGPHDVIEGPFGYMRLIEGEWDLKPILARFGKKWAVSELSHKPFPTGRAAHSVLSMLGDMLDTETISTDDIDNMTVSVPPLIKRLMDRPYKDGISLSQARLCLPFLMATRVIKGPVDLNSYERGWYESRSWHALADKITITLDGNEDPNALDPQALSLRTRDGQEFKRHMPATLGSPSNPLTPTQQFEKFAACLDYANITGADKRESQWQALQSIASCDDVGKLVDTYVKSKIAV